MKQVIAFLSAILCLVAFRTQPLVAAPATQQDQNRCLISSPVSGSQLQGQVVITGSATHADFQWYRLGYAPDPNPDGKYTFFTSSETAVPSGRLGVWDTSQVPDGTYQLILEVYRKDTNNDHCFVQKLYVNNTAPTATFTAQPLPTAANTPTPFPTSPATPTVAIEQPPTATPRPTPTYSPIDNPTPTAATTGFKLPIDPGSIQNASCRGAELTIAVAVVVVLYFVIRSIMISGVRRFGKPRDIEGFHTRRPRQN